MWTFPDFQYYCRSSLSTIDLWTGLSDRISRAFNRPGAIRAVALYIFKAFDRVFWHAGLFHKLKCYGISSQVFGFISSFFSNRRLQAVLEGKFSQEYPVNAGIPQGAILGPTLFPLYINDLADDFICNIATCADDTTLYTGFDQTCDLLQQQGLASELESHLQDTQDWNRNQFVDFNTRKTQPVSFDWSNNTGAIDVRMDGPVLEKKSFFKMLLLTFCSRFDWSSYIISIPKSVSKDIGAVICSMKLHTPALYLYKSTKEPCLEFCCYVWACAPSCYWKLLD